MVRRCPYQSCQKLYEDYYSQQVGHGLPVFAGGRTFRGRGLGSLLAGIGRAVVPLLKRGGKALLKEGARTGMQVAHDVLWGQRIGSSLKQRAGQAGKRLFHQAVSHAAGGGRGSKRIKRNSPNKKKQTTSGKRRRKNQQHERDIFG